MSKVSRSFTLPLRFFKFDVNIVGEPRNYGGTVNKYINTSLENVYCLAPNAG